MILFSIAILAMIFTQCCTIYPSVYIRVGKRAKYSPDDTRVIYVDFEIQSYRLFAQFIKKQIPFSWDNTSESSIDCGIFVGYIDL